MGKGPFSMRSGSEERVQWEKTTRPKSVEPGRTESESVALPAVAANEVINSAQAISRQTTTAIRAMRPPTPDAAKLAPKSIGVTAFVLPITMNAEYCIGRA